MHSNLSGIKNYIFDMDGTLVDSLTEVLSCLRLACEKTGIKIDENKFNSNIIGPPLKEIIKSIIFKEDDFNQVEKAVSEFRRIYDNDDNDASVLYENIYEWLLYLKHSDKKLFVATNKPTIPTFRLIKKFNLNIFEDVYTIDKYKGKLLSKQEMIEEIIERNGLKKSETVMIGDSINDMKAAHDAGIIGVGAIWGYGDNKKPLKNLSDMTLELSDINLLGKR